MLIAHLPATRRRLQALVLAAVLAVVLVATSVAHPAKADAPPRVAAPAPTVTISTTDTLQQIVTALRTVTAGQTIQIVDPATRKFDTRTACTIGVSLVLYALVAGAVAYIAATGAPVLILGITISAGTLAGLAASRISWPSVYRFVNEKVCTKA